jgi:hypothetical protein
MATEPGTPETFETANSLTSVTGTLGAAHTSPTPPSPPPQHAPACARCREPRAQGTDRYCPACVAAGAALLEHQCMSCGYELANPLSLRCSECGIEPVPDDFRMAERVELFLRFTRAIPGRIFAWCAIALVLSLIVRIDLFALVVLAFCVAGPLATSAVGRLAFSSLPGLPRRVARRLWSINTPWIQLPWLFAALAVFIARGAGYSWSGWSRDMQYEDWCAALVGGTTGTILGFILWRWRWSAWSNDAGLPLLHRSHPRVRWAFRLIYLPQFLLVVVPAVLFAIYAILDTLAPNWWRG